MMSHLEFGVLLIVNTITAGKQLTSARKRLHVQ
jgi:hypothetical protein